MASAAHNIHPRYRADIDGLRAIAILAVLIFHAFPSSLRGGFAGVDIFFVISGYLISGIILKGLEQQNFSFSEFYAHRIRRIFPALILVMASSYIFAWQVLLPDEFKQFGKQMAASAAFVQNYVLWHEAGYFDTSSALKPLLHLWSLSIEEQFYLIFPLLLWSIRRTRLAPGFLLLILFMLSLRLNIRLSHHDVSAAFYRPQSRFWELLAGALLAYGQVFPERSAWLPGLRRAVHPGQAPRQQAGLRGLSSILGLLLLATALIGLSQKQAYPGWRALIPVIGTLLLIHAGPGAWVNRQILARRLMVWIGLISYPLYLWHWPLLAFTRIVVATPGPGLRAAALGLSLLLAWLSYHLLEQPLRTNGPGWRKNLILCLLITALGSIGWITCQKEGLAFRFPKIVGALINYRYDYISGYRGYTCFLGPKQGYEQFADCGVSRDKHKKSIFIWGDSHAADLYPGYKDYFSTNYNLIQRTTSGCPPILGYSNTQPKFCNDINQKIFMLIEREKPDEVVLAARWIAYPNPMDIINTIKQLKGIGIRSITLIGPDPEWKNGLPRQVYLQYKNNSFHRIPLYMDSGLNHKSFTQDSSMMALAASEHIQYFSPMRILCNSQGCLTRVGDGADALTSWDYGHLTGKGSDYLVAHFPMH